MLEDFFRMIAYFVRVIAYFFVDIVFEWIVRGVMRLSPRRWWHRRRKIGTKSSDG